MLRHYYIPRNMPGLLYPDLVRTLRNWAIELVAVGVHDATTLEPDDIQTISNQEEDVQYWFQVKDAPEQITAHDWLHNMLSEMFADRSNGAY